MPAGRPTDYDPSYCDMLIEHLKQGYSFESFAADVDVCKDTLYEWIKAHPEFSDAKKRGTAKSQKWWEKKSIDHLIISKDGDRLDTGNWIFNMRNRFGWRDRPEETTEDTLPGGLFKNGDEPI